MRRNGHDPGHTDNDLTNPDDNLKVPNRPGEAPRPATEPAGAQGSASNAKTKADPVTGEPNRHRP